VSANHPNRREGRPVIRLFGAFEIEDCPRTLGARDLGGARPKQVLEILLAARGHRSRRIGSPTCSGEINTSSNAAGPRPSIKPHQRPRWLQAFCKHRASAAMSPRSA
jgi:hypothetical protein